MTDPPAAGDFNADDTKLQGVSRQDWEDLLGATKELPGGKPSSQLILSSGQITPTGAVHTVDTEAAASSDNLDFVDLTNHPSGRLLLLRPHDDNRTVVVRSGVSPGNISLLFGDSEYHMTNTSMGILLINQSGVLEEILRWGREDVIEADSGAPDPDFSNDWVGGAYAMRWFKGPDGIVHVAGIAQSVTPESSGMAIVTLDDQHRPPTGTLHYFPVYDFGAGGVQAVSISGAGVVTFIREVGSTDQTATLSMNLTFPTFL